MAYLVLARKYRPQTFDEVVGQDHITSTLKKALASGRVAHALLFSGIRGVGKTSVARILAKALNCEQGPAENPCNQCSLCQEITAGRAVDVHEIDGASNRGIDEIRELRENIRFLPARARYKIYIIDEVHMLTKEAFNALLKTLEEPPGHVYFVLATTEAHKVPLTIVSRCQRYEFRRLPVRRLMDHLRRIAAAEGLEIEEGALSLIAQAAEGSIRDALSLLDQALAAGARTEAQVIETLGLVSREVIQELIIAILEADSKGAISVIGRAADFGYDLLRLSEDLVVAFRDLMVIRLCGADEELINLPPEEIGRLEALARKISPETLHLYFQILLREHEQVRRSAIPRLALEMAVLKASQVKNVVSLEEVLKELKRLKSGTSSSPAPRGTSDPSSRDLTGFIAFVRGKSPPLAICLRQQVKDKIWDKGILAIKVPKGGLLEHPDRRRLLETLLKDYFGPQAQLKIDFYEEPSQNNGQQLRRRLLQDSLVQEAVRIFNARISGVKTYSRKE
ncbi:DNA polymerase III subunit gamma/tau [Thermosulfuriphilus sp.]